jgi:hypothetical protein
MPKGSGTVLLVYMNYFLTRNDSYSFSEFIFPVKTILFQYMNYREYIYNVYKCYICKENVKNVTTIYELLKLCYTVG